MTYFDGPTNKSNVIWEDNGFLHPFRFNRSSTSNSMFISFRSSWRLPRTYGFFFRIYCNPPAKGSSRTYNTKPEFCLSKSIIKSKFISRNNQRQIFKDQNWNPPENESKANLIKPESRGELEDYSNQYQDPEIIHNQSSRKLKGTSMFNYNYRDDNTNHNSRFMSIQSSKTNQFDSKPKSRSMSKIFSQSSMKGFEKSLGHDLDQLTKGNHHEVNLSPYPSLTIMVQPNKIDYSKRRMYMYHKLYKNLTQVV